MRNLTPSPRRNRTSCSVLALATVLVVGATPASAQSFLGSGSFTHNGGGSAGITTAPNTTTITVNSGSTVIDWTPTDNAIGGGSINFQNSGTTANFLGTGGFVVLNRINPADSTRSITMNGTIQTLALGAAAAANGSLYFYTPGGFVIGGSAVINVGSLVLSASPITVDGNGTFVNGPNNTVTFGQASQAAAQINIASGAQINTLANTGSYVAIVAPSIVQNGTINLSGSAALVAAEAATINFSPDGLFDIQVTSGTTSSFGISTNGNIGGAASTGPGDNNRIDMVAVPKNQALTMVIAAGADLGFDVAGAANVDGNAIVLSAGYDIVDGVAGTVRSAGGGSGNASINASNMNASSAFSASATGTATVSATAGNSSSFASDLSLTSLGNARVGASGAGSTLTINGDVTVSVDRSVAAGASGTAAQASLISSTGGQTHVTGNVSLSAIATGADSTVSGIAGGNATGGFVYAQADSSNGSDLEILGDLSMRADGTGGAALTAGSNAGSGTGGTIQIMSFGSASMIVEGATSATADGRGGDAICTSCNGFGGSGTGGRALVGAVASGSPGTNGSLALGSIGNGTRISLTGTGGASAGGGSGGTGLGGSVEIRTNLANSVTSIDGPLSINVDGSGGAAGGSGLDGGTGLGGTATIFSSGSNATLRVNGSVDVTASGFGGSSGGEGCQTCTGTGGAGTGGEIQFSTSNGAAGTALTVNGDIDAFTQGNGGFGIAAGGIGSGGTTTSTYSSASAITLNGTVEFFAVGRGGDTFDGVGGAGLGGRAALGSQTGATGSLTVTGDVTTDASGFGGDAFNSGSGGFGDGGLTDNGGSAGTIDFEGDVTAIARAGGGYSENGTGGNALGGDGWVDAFGATITIDGSFSVDTTAVGGDGVSGGDATGGNGYLSAIAGLTVDGDATVTSNGSGGAGFSGAGGDGQGGLALIRSSAGATLAIGGDATANANGFGGDSSGFTDGFGGSGTGGTARITELATGAAATIDIDGSAVVSASGEGGDVFSLDGGTGGTGTGGSAYLGTIGGTITVGEAGSGAGASIIADGTGGRADNGLGGDGIGGTVARLEAIDGDVTIDGYAGISASGFGGSGFTGGDGIGGGAAGVTGTGSFIFARNGDVTILGGAGVTAVGTGGDGSDDDFGYNGDNGGNGGNGTGGFASIFAQNSDLGPSLIDIDGGSGEGAGSLFVSVSGTGGDGGAGLGGNLGGLGGNGGNAAGGTALVHAAAGNGVVNIGALSIDATASGGLGGNGGNGDGQAGGDGGNGGNAVGGIASFGTETGSAQSAAVNNGQANLGIVTADASATGGGGGDGSFGAIDGNGGDGGDASSGRSLLLVRGSLVDAGSVTLIANATGGDGGFGAGDNGARGNGGDATIGDFFGSIDVVVTERLGNIAQRGTLLADSITGTSIATAGVGEIDGLSQTLGDNVVAFRNSGGALGSLEFLIQADTIGAGATEDAIAVHPNGVVTIDGELSFVTSATLSLLLDNATVTADTIRWQAFDFVPDTVTVTPAANGTFFANSFDISTQNNFLAAANLDSVAALSIVAPGAIQVGNVTGDSDISLQAQSGEIEAGNITGGGNVDVLADDFIAAGNIVGAGLVQLDAGSTIDVGTIDNSGNTNLFAGVAIDVGAIDSGNGAVVLLTGLSSIDGDAVTAGSIYAESGADLFLGDVTAPGDIELLAVGDMIVGNAQAGQYIELEAGGYIDGGNMTAGASVYAEAAGAIDLLDVSAGIVDQSFGEGVEYNVGILSGVSIETGDIAALDSVGVGSFGDITTGSVDAGDIFLALSGGDMSFGAINSGGTTYLADDSMITLGGGLGDEDFDPFPILAATPVASGGSITLGGPVNSGRFEAAAGTTLSGGDIDSGSLLYATSGGNMTLGDLFAFGDVRLTSGGNIVAGSVESGDDIVLVSAGSITTDEIFAYDDVSADAGATITTDDITGNTIDLFADGAIETGDLLTRLFFGNDAQLSIGTSITIDSGGDVVTGDIDALNGVAIFGASITTGNIIADDSVGLFTPGDLAVGTVNAGADVVALVGDDATFGAITTPARFFLGGYSMFALVGDGEDFDPSAIFETEQRSSTGGSATFGGSSAVESFEAYVGEDTTIASLTVSDFADFDTGDLLSINGTINGGYITLLSSDIAIGQAAQINAPEGISFLSINSVGTYIGDNIPGQTGYRLSQAEVDRVNANQLEFEVQTERGAAGLMRLGDLDLAIDSGAEDDGNVEFSISSEDEEGGTGIIRVVGDVNVTLGSEQMVEFEAQTFEIDAATGSLALSDTLGGLSGILSLEASNIFIASGDILTRLEANPQYAGFREELNAPAAVQRPDGVIRAAVVTLGEDAVDLENILIQNTGTSALPAGFLVDILTFYSDEDDGPAPAPGSINMVINGQVQTESGTVGGIAVRDGLVEEFGTELFLAGSTINGCQLTGTCIGNPTTQPPPQVDTIVRTDVQINDLGGLGDGLFGNEGDIDDGETGDEGVVSSPIAPTNPLFDSRPLAGDVDVDDPISGAGNPSLMGTSEEEIAVCDSSTDKDCESGTKGDGK